MVIVIVIKFFLEKVMGIVMGIKKKYWNFNYNYSIFIQRNLKNTFKLVKKKIYPNYFLFI